jgi:hypothetical protein
VKRLMVVVALAIAPLPAGAASGLEPSTATQRATLAVDGDGISELPEVSPFENCERGPGSDGGFSWGNTLSTRPTSDVAPGDDDADCTTHPVTYIP